MACGATLKRSMEFEALLGPQSPKRRRCSPLAGAAATPSPQRCSLRPQPESPATPVSPPATSGEHRLTPGSLASSIFDPYSALVGASGGVYALIGGYFMNAVVNFREMIPLLGVFRITVIVLIVGTDVGFALYRRFLSDAAGIRVSFVAHIGGGIAGMTIGYVFFSNYNQKLLRDPRFWFCIVGYIIFLLFAVFFNIFLSPAPR
ncbi:hypothetical protein PDJAM_G00121720 [Pangasius djambal]|uniref:Uncharacterized protein n=1 Tax=Pangasius djambal TaxID=1691987 RepID=A0ACC5ZA72_9TELE|nr:hypothetical protein [Pangasius djambal]